MIIINIVDSQESSVYPKKSRSGRQNAEAWSNV